MTAAAPRILMGTLPAFSPLYTIGQSATPSVPASRLKNGPICRFRRLHPIVPDRAAFGAAIEREADGDHAENQYQSPEHGRSVPHAPIIPPQVWHFQAAPNQCPFPPNAL